MLEELGAKVPGTFRWFGVGFALVVAVIVLTPLFSPLQMRLGNDAVLVRTYSSPTFLLAVVVPTPSSSAAARAEPASKEILWSGMYQESVMTAYWTLLSRGPASDRDVVVDIGPGVGFSTFHAAAMGYEVFAFEVESSLRPFLELSTQVNSFTDSKEWRVSLSEQFICDGTGHEEGIKQDISLDEFFGALADEPRRIRMLRISSKGAEEGILRGARDLIQSSRIDHMVLDLRCFDENVDCLALLRLLEQALYYIYHIYDLYSFIEISPREFPAWVEEQKSSSSSSQRIVSVIASRTRVTSLRT